MGRWRKALAELERVNEFLNIQASPSNKAPQ